MKLKHTLQNRWGTLTIMCFTIFALALAGCATETAAPKSVTVGIVHLTNGVNSSIESFKLEMADLGYVEGENITYVYDGVLENAAAAAPALQALADQQVDLIFALNTPVNVQAKLIIAGTDMPVVFAAVYDPVGADIVDSVQSPGGNITGVRGRGFVPKTLERLLTIVPNIERIYAPYNSNDTSSVLAMAELYEAAGQLNVEVVEQAVTNAEELADALAAFPENVDAIVIPPGGLLAQNIDSVIEVALAHNLPLTSFVGGHVSKTGVLMTYGPDFPSMGVKAARLADQILSGNSSPDELPVETTNFLFNVNQQTAETIGIEISESALRDADDIIRTE